MSEGHTSESRLQQQPAEVLSGGPKRLQGWLAGTTANKSREDQQPARSHGSSGVSLLATSLLVPYPGQSVSESDCEAMLDIPRVIPWDHGCAASGAGPRRGDCKRHDVSEERDTEEELYLLKSANGVAKP